MRLFCIGFMFVLCFFVSVIHPARSQTSGTEITWIAVPLPPGGATDLLVRPIAEKLSKKYGRSFLVTNRPGASGIIGGDYVAKALPDGHTLLVTPAGFVTNVPHMRQNMPYDMLNDLIPVVQIATSAYVLVSHPSVPVRTVKDLINLAKARPPLSITFGSAGVGTGHHLSGELLNQMAGIKMLHVPYNGTPPAIRELLGGHIDIMIVPVLVAKPLAEGGRLRMIAVTGTTRESLIPDIPTFAESGLTGYEMTNWHGMFVPRGTPLNIVTYLSDAVHSVLASPEMKDVWKNNGVEFVPNTPAQFYDIVKRDYIRSGTLIRAIEIKE